LETQLDGPPKDENGNVLRRRH